MGKIIDIDTGRIVVASDLSGNWDDYRRIRDRFTGLRKRGKADLLVLDGDLIHGYPGYEDRSVDILDDLINNPDPSVIALLGNHELMQIYHMGQVTKAGQSFVEPFERQLEEGGRDRNRYVGFMKQMPYAIRTAGGVTINHTGANPPMAGFTRKAYGNLPVGESSFGFVDDLDHDDVLEGIKTVLEKQHGRKLADDDYTPQVGDLFMRTAIGSYLWDVFFNKNEHEFGNEVYKRMLDEFLRTMGHGGRTQRFLVTGHIEVIDGCQIIGGKQFRICSGYGAIDPCKALAYVDAGKRYSSAKEIETMGLVDLGLDD